MAKALRSLLADGILLRRVALPFLIGAMAGLGHPPFDLWFVTVLAFSAGFLRLQRVKTVRSAVELGLWFGTGYFAMSLHWIVEPFFVDPWRHGWMAPFAIVLLSMGLAIFWAAAFGLAKRLSPLAWTVVPVLTLAELLRAYVLTGFPWAMPSYVLLEQWSGQGAAWIGSHGMNLVVFAVAWVASWGIAKRNLGVSALPILGFVLLAVPMPDADPTGAATEARPIVRLVQPNAPQHQKWDPDYSGLFFERLVRFSAQGAERPDLIVWPETAVPVLLNYADETLNIISRSARGTPVVLGINRFEGRLLYNAAVLLDAQGQIAATYDKHHLVPFGEFIPLGDLLGQMGITGLASRNGEGFSAGPGPEVMDLGALGQALLLICYEAVFPQDVRGVAQRPSFILHLTNDAWFGNFSGPFQHLAQARIRAIESGLPVLRAANTGVSAAIDARGRVVQSLPLNTDGFLDVALPKPHSATLYWQIGDMPVAIAALLLLAGAGFGRIKRKRLTSL